MSRKWIPLAAALALLAGAGQGAGAAAAQDAKATPVPSASAAQGKTATATPPTAKKKLLNLNAASREELKGLPGGSEEEAARIIAGRPYNSKAVLVINKVISEGRYAQIKTLVVAGEPAKPSR